MNILVTGAGGFLGRALCPSLHEDGHLVVALDSKNCDLTRSDSLEQFSGERFDQIYHLAAWYQAGDFCLTHTGEYWLMNQAINTHVLAWWQQRQPRAKLIATGSSCAYPPECELAEENFLTGDPIESLYTYGHTKRMLLIGLRSLHKQFRLPYLCLVPSTLFGPGFHTDGRQLHFIFDLIRKIVRGKRFDEPVVLWGDGHQKRELVYVDDVVGIMKRLAESHSNDLVNIAGGEEHSIREFAQIICQLTGYDFGKVQFDTSRYVGAKSKRLVTAKLDSLMPKLQFTPIEIGLKRTVDWFLEYGENLLRPRK